MPCSHSILQVTAKEAAEKRAKELDSLEDEFGVGELVNAQLKEEQQKEYDSKNLSGLKVNDKDKEKK